MMRDIDASTQLYCVIGNPVSHSMSPSVHNLAFWLSGLNAVYTAFQVVDIEAAVSGIRGLGIRGASVTIPHKQDIMGCLDHVDGIALEMGAVNTVVNRDGKLYGYNTDVTGAIASIKEKTEIRGKRVVVLGAGGAARAVGFGVRKEGARLTICNRSHEKGERLAESLSSKFLPLSSFHGDECDILINTTSVGMSPEIMHTPVKGELLHGGMVVMDIVYNPLKTRLLQEAEACGATVIDGVSMFVYQAAEQFRLWTDRPAPTMEMRKRVIELLTGA